MTELKVEKRAVNVETINVNYLTVTPPIYLDLFFDAQCNEVREVNGKIIL